MHGRVQVPLFMSPGWRLLALPLADGGMQYLVFDTQAVSEEQARGTLAGASLPGVYVVEGPLRRFYTTLDDLEQMQQVRAVGRGVLRGGCPGPVRMLAISR
jgi:hypothetical protein